MRSRTQFEALGHGLVEIATIRILPIPEVRPTDTQDVRCGLVPDCSSLDGGGDCVRRLQRKCSREDAFVFHVSLEGRWPTHGCRGGRFGRRRSRYCVEKTSLRAEGLKKLPSLDVVSFDFRHLPAPGGLERQHCLSNLWVSVSGGAFGPSLNLARQC